MNILSNFQNDTDINQQSLLVSNNNFNNMTLNLNSVNLTNDISDPPVEWYLIMLLSMLYGTISVVCLMGNSLIIWTVAKNEKLQFIINIFISNLAVSDIIIGLLVAPFQVSICLIDIIIQNLFLKIV